MISDGSYQPRISGYGGMQNSFSVGRSGDVRFAAEGQGSRGGRASFPFAPSVSMDHGSLGLTRMTESEADRLDGLIRAGRAIRGSSFPVP